MGDVSLRSRVEMGAPILTLVKLAADSVHISQFDLNDVCDALRLHAEPPSAIRSATPPSKNALLDRQPLRPTGSRPLLGRPRPFGNAQPRLWPGPPPARRCAFPHVLIKRLRYVTRGQRSPTKPTGRALRPA